jgi:hypothetical protein
MKRHNWKQHSEGTLAQVQFTMLISLLCVQLHTAVYKVSVVFCTVIFLCTLYVYGLLLMKSVQWPLTNIHLIVYQWCVQIFSSSLLSHWSQGGGLWQWQCSSSQVLPRMVKVVGDNHLGVRTAVQWLVRGVVTKYSKGCDMGCSIYGQMFFLGRL